MKIAHVTSFFNPKYYKANEYVISQQLAKLGHEVVLFCPKQDPVWQSNREADQYRAKSEEFDGFKVQRITGEPIFLNMPTMPALFRFLRKQDFDIIHSHEYFSFCTFQSALASKIKTASLFITQHNDRLPAAALSRIGYLLDSFTMGKFSFSEAKKVIALSHDIKLHLLHMGFSREKVEVIPTAVDSEVFSPDNSNLLKEKWGISSPIVLFVGRLVPEKGAQFLIPAFKEVIKEIPDANLVVVGKGPQENQLRNLQKQLEIKNIFFIGRIENQLMPKIYTGCDALVMPSLSEPFGNVVLEAMASGKPVIGSYVGGIKDTIVHGKTGYHVSPRDIKTLGQFICQILKDEHLSKKLGQNARNRVLHRYDSKIVAEKIEKLYFDALSGQL